MVVVPGGRVVYADSRKTSETVLVNVYVEISWNVVVVVKKSVCRGAVLVVVIVMYLDLVRVIALGVVVVVGVTTLTRLTVTVDRFVFVRRGTVLTDFVA
jgi:hypothetical protein